MNRIKYILLVIQAIAIILYPSAMVGLAAAPSLTAESMAISSDRGHAVDQAQHAHRNWSSSDHDGAVAVQSEQSSNANGLEAIPCCCSGPAGLCAIFASDAPFFGAPGHKSITPKFGMMLHGIAPLPIPHPPKPLHKSYCPLTRLLAQGYQRSTNI